MKSLLAILTLIMSMQTFSQSRTTGSGHSNPPPIKGPDSTSLEPELFTRPSDSAETVVGLVKYNMQVCHQDKNVAYESGHIKDVYNLVQALQFANVLEGWKSLNHVTCQSEIHDHLSADVRCLLNGTEEALYHFTKHKESEAYLVHAGLKKEDAQVMIKYLKDINELMLKEREANSSQFQFKINSTILKNSKKKHNISN